MKKECNEDKEKGKEGRRDEDRKEREKKVSKCIEKVGL